MAKMVNRSVGDVEGIVLQGCKYKAPNYWKGNQMLSDTQKEGYG